MKDPMCILFNTIFMTLHDRMRKNEFVYAFANSSSLACKIWGLENDWEALLTHNPDHRNAKPALNDIMAKNTKQEDDALSKQTKLLRESYGLWETKKEMEK